MRALRLEGPVAVGATLGSLPARGRFCLDGTRAHPEGRWTFLGAEPAEVIEVAFGERAPLTALARLDSAVETAAEMGGDLIDLRVGDVPRWVGWVSYDLAWSDPRRTGIRATPRWARGAWPVISFARYETLIAIETLSGAAWALGPNEQACERLAATIARGPRAESLETASVGEVQVEDPARHRARIEAALEAIAAGDLYQVNLARAWRAPYAGSVLPLVSAMRSASPVPFGAYLEVDAGAVVCRTMERFLRWDRAERRLRTSPIKGTIARSGVDDAAEARELLRDPKERAEHTMIVDLMRNDLSRVAEVGSVRVREPLRVEPFAGLSHLVSTVECVTRRSVGVVEVLEATFPPGSVTGTPKLAAVELIERAESEARGVYTGAVGYVDRAGGLSLAVAIRTAIVSDASVTYFAGGGLVSASDPEREIAETDLKARVFLDALRSIRGGASQSDLTA